MSKVNTTLSTRQELSVCVSHCSFHSNLDPPVFDVMDFSSVPGYFTQEGGKHAFEPVDVEADTAYQAQKIYMTPGGSLSLAAPLRPSKQ